MRPGWPMFRPMAAPSSARANAHYRSTAVSSGPPTKSQALVQPSWSLTIGLVPSGTRKSTQPTRSPPAVSLSRFLPRAMPRSRFTAPPAPSACRTMFPTGFLSLASSPATTKNAFSGFRPALPRAGFLLDITTCVRKKADLQIPIKHESKQIQSARHHSRDRSLSGSVDNPYRRRDCLILQKHHPGYQEGQSDPENRRLGQYHL